MSTWFKRLKVPTGLREQAAACHAHHHEPPTVRAYVSDTLVVDAVSPTRSASLPAAYAAAVPPPLPGLVEDAAGQLQELNRLRAAGAL